MKQILLVNQSSGYLMVDIVNAFVNSGKYDKVELFAGEIHIRPSVPDKSVHVIKTVKYNKNSMLKRLLSWTGAFLHLLFVVWFRDRNCELFLVSNPPLTTFAPLFTKKKYSILIYDLYPDSLFSQGFVDRDSFVARWWSKKNRKVFAKAENVFTISDDMRRTVAQYVEDSKIKVVYNWAHNEHLKPVEKADNSFLKNLQLEDKFIVLYSGNMGMTHDIDVLVDVAKTLKDIAKIHFLFIGEGAKKAIIEQKIADYQLQNCSVMPFQPLGVLPYSMGAADIAVVTTDANQTGLSVPSKTYSYLSVGAILLCLADKKSELGRMVVENHVGECFNRDEVTEMAAFVQDMASHGDKQNQLKNNSRALSMDYTPDNAKQYVI